MALVVNTNITSLIAQRRLNINSNQLRQSMERLSSGFRINRAADDAAGLTISQNLVSQVRRFEQAMRNTQDGISVLQVAEGALSVMGENLQRIRELTVQAANDTNNTSARTAITAEIQELIEDMDRIAASTQFNGLSLLDGTYRGVLAGGQDAEIQVGGNSTVTTNVVNLSPGLQDVSSTALGLIGPSSTPGFLNVKPPGANPIDLTVAANIPQFLGDIDRALTQINLQRGNIGSLQNKLESVTANLDMAIENFSTSNSRIRDVDIAEESATMVQSQILTEAATTVLSQTNQLPRLILSLLQQ